MLRLVSIPDAGDACVTVQSGRDVVILVAASLLSPTAAAVINAALKRLDPRRG